MKDNHPSDSIRLFFQTFAMHLQRIRDDREDAKKGYRAQVLLSQLNQFEKAVLEQQTSSKVSGIDRRSSLALFRIQDLESLAHWIEREQDLVEVAGLFFLNSQGKWRRLAGKAELPARLKIKEWVRRGLLGRVEGESRAFAAYLYGQPRLVVVFSDAGDSDSESQSQFAEFWARILPLYLSRPVEDPAGKARNPSGGLVAKDAAFLELLQLIKQAAKKDVSILLEGESGTGKEVIAEFIHRNSPRSSKNLVAVNCAAIPAGLIESELFGHEKGAFTGAYNRQIGRVEEADGGTLFLDEIGEMELAMQAKLLRFLQLHEFHRVGGKKKVSVNVRIVAATNRNIKKRVAQGKFREDLYYRLAVMPFNVPALRQRVDDIVPLARHFLVKYAREFEGRVPEIDEQVYQLLACYDFPGNVRELENLIQNVLVVAQGGRVKRAHLPKALQLLEPKGAPVSNPRGGARTWNRVNSYGRRIKLNRISRPGDKQPPREGLPKWRGEVPKDNMALKEMKREIQEHAAGLTLELEHRFLKDLLERAGGSMPRASKLGNINRTLLYKMIDRTKHLE